MAAGKWSECPRCGQYTISKIKDKEKKRYICERCGNDKTASDQLGELNYV